MSDLRDGIEAEKVKFLEEFDLMMNTVGRVLIVNLKAIDAEPEEGEWDTSLEYDELLQFELESEQEAAQDRKLDEQISRQVDLYFYNGEVLKRTRQRHVH